MITYNKKDIPEHLQKYFEPAELGLEKTPDCNKQGIMRLRKNLTIKEIEKVIKFFSHN